MSDTIIKIPAELFALAECSHFQGEYDLPELAMGPDDYTFAAPLAWRVDVTNTGAALLVEGAVTGRAPARARVASKTCSMISTGR